MSILLPALNKINKHVAKLDVPDTPISVTVTAQPWGFVDQEGSGTSGRRSSGKYPAIYP